MPYVPAARASHDTRLKKTISLVVAFCLGAAQAVPVFARDDDRYSYTTNRNQDYQNQYRPDRNYSPSYQLDRQISNMNVALQVRKMSTTTLQANALKFNFAMPSQPVFKPTIKFEIGWTNQQNRSLVSTKTNLLPNAAALAPKANFVNTIGNAFRTLGRVLAVPFQKIGQGIINLIQRAFGTSTPVPPKLTESQKATLSGYRNLQPTGEGTFKVTGGQTFAFLRTWEEGSTFKLDGDQIKLIQGTSYDKNYGGIERKDGGLLPLRMENAHGAIQPTGIDFSRLVPNTTLFIKSPMTIEGFGEVKSGEMTFQGVWQSPDGRTTGGRFQFQNSPLDLNKDMAQGLGMDNPAVLRQATFSLQAGLMRLNSAEIQFQNKRLFVQENRPPLDIDNVDENLTAIGLRLGEAKGQYDKAEKDFSNAGVAARGMLANLTKATGQTETVPFKEPGGLKFLKEESKSLSAMASQIDRDMKAGNYQEASDALPEFNLRTEVFKARTEGAAAQAEMTKAFFREVRDLTKDIASVGRVVDMGEVGKDGVLSPKQVQQGYERFPAPEKRVFASTADHAQKTLVKLVEAEAIDPASALDWAMTIKIAKDKLLAAGPSRLEDRVRVAATHPQATISEATNEAADRYVFNQLANFAETLPGTMEAVGQVGYYVSKGAKALGQAAGIGLMVAFPVTSIAVIGTDLAVDYGLKKAGVNEDLAGFAGMAAGAVMGIGVAGNVKVSHVEAAWARRIGADKGVGQIIGEFKEGFKDTVQWTAKTVQSDAGHMYIGEFTKNEARAAANTATKGFTPKKPWGNQDPFTFFMNEVEKLDVHTPPNKAVFYSGKDKISGVENRLLAERFAKENGKFTIEMSPGGKWLDEQNLFGHDTPLSFNEARLVWARLSERFARSSSGEANAFTLGARPGSIFETVEYPTIKATQRVHQVITRDGR